MRRGLGGGLGRAQGLSEEGISLSCSQQPVLQPAASLLPPRPPPSIRRLLCAPTAGRGIAVFVMKVGDPSVQLGFRAEELVALRTQGLTGTLPSPLESPHSAGPGFFYTQTWKISLLKGGKDTQICADGLGSPLCPPPTVALGEHLHRVPDYSSVKK